jgi:hypothetical protein
MPGCHALRLRRSHVLHHPTGREKLPFQRAKIINKGVAEGLESLGQYGVIEKEARYVFQYPQSFPETVQVGIDKSQH